MNRLPIPFNGGTLCVDMEALVSVDARWAYGQNLPLGALTVFLTHRSAADVRSRSITPWSYPPELNDYHVLIFADLILINGTQTHLPLPDFTKLRRPRGCLSALFSFWFPLPDPARDSLDKIANELPAVFPPEIKGEMGRWLTQTVLTYRALSANLFLVPTGSVYRDLPPASDIEKADKSSVTAWAWGGQASSDKEQCPSYGSRAPTLVEMEEEPCGGSKDGMPEMAEDQKGPVLGYGGLSKNVSSLFLI